MQPAGIVAMLFIVALIMVVTIPEVTGWYGDWKSFADGTVLAGECSDPNAAEGCEDTRAMERWELVPWGMTFGLLAALLVLCFPRDLNWSKYKGWFRRVW